jgi:hypothetical protein
MQDGRHIEAPWIRGEILERLITEEEFLNNEEKYMGQFNKLAIGGKVLEPNLNQNEDEKKIEQSA